MKWDKDLFVAKLEYKGQKIADTLDKDNPTDCKMVRRAVRILTTRYRIQRSYHRVLAILRYKHNKGGNRYYRSVKSFIKKYIGYVN